MRNSVDTRIAIDPFATRPEGPELDAIDQFRLCFLEPGFQSGPVASVGQLDGTQPACY